MQIKNNYGFYSMSIKSFRVQFKSKGHNISGLLDIQDKHKDTLIILLHGLTNSMKDCPLINEAQEALSARGFSTFRFDYYGSGLSEGEFKEKTFSIMVQNTRDALGYVTEKLHFKKVGIWGRSLGAILGATICDDKHITASVLISFCVHTDTSFSSFFAKDKPYSLPIKGTGEVKGESVLPYQFYKETTWVNQLQRNHLSRASNVLVIQGTEDKTVYDTHWAKEIYEMTQEPKKLIYVQGADHSYRGFESNVITEGLNWFEKHLN